MTVAVLTAADIHDWNNLATIKAGENIRIVQANQISVEGEYASFSDSNLTLRSTAGELSIERERIVRVSTRPRQRRQRNAAIGALIAGGAAGRLNIASNLPGRRL